MKSVVKKTQAEFLPSPSYTLRTALGNICICYGLFIFVCEARSFAYLPVCMYTQPMLFRKRDPKQIETMFEEEKLFLDQSFSCSFDWCTCFSCKSNIMYRKTKRE